RSSWRGAIQTTPPEHHYTRFAASTRPSTTSEREATWQSRLPRSPQHEVTRSRGAWGRACPMKFNPTMPKSARPGMPAWEKRRLAAFRGGSRSLLHAPNSSHRESPDSPTRVGYFRSIYINFPRIPPPFERAQGSWYDAACIGTGHWHGTHGGCERHHGRGGD